MIVIESIVLLLCVLSFLGVKYIEMKSLEEITEIKLTLNILHTIEMESKVRIEELEKENIGLLQRIDDMENLHVFYATGKI